MLRSLLTYAFLMLALKMLASDNVALIVQANKDYADGLYNNAIIKYERVLDNGFEAPELYYNLGNAYYKTNDIPSAILFYEKAKRLDPNDDAIRHNLALANSRIIDKHETLPVIFYKRWWNKLYNVFGLKTWTLIQLGSFLLLMICAMVFFTTYRPLVKRISFWAGMVLLALTLTSFGFSYQKHKSLTTTREAIVFDPSVTIKSSPSDSSIDLFVVHEGTKVKLLDTLGEWHEIKISNGSVGWLHNSAIRMI